MSGVNPRPIRLVYCDEQDGFHIDSEAVSILDRLKGPIAVVSVSGPAKDGKSFLSNQLQGRTSGFELGPLPHKKCTKGLWMWSTPSTTTAADDGTEYNLIVIDMEGIDDCAQVEQYFYLALVLSSMLLYNEMARMDDSSVYLLSHLTKLTDKIVGDTTASDLQHFFPIFVWLLRDFFVNRSGMSPKESMESFFKPVDVHGEDVIFHNEVRKSLQAVFTNRHCFGLRRPMIEEKDLCYLHRVSMDRLRPEFKKDMDELRSFVFEKTKPKKIGTTVMTGPIFVQITRYILDAFNNGKMPIIACIWENFEITKPTNSL